MTTSATLELEENRIENGGFACFVKSSPEVVAIERKKRFDTDSSLEERSLDEQNRRRAEQIREQKIEYIFSSAFEDPNAGEKILTPTPPAQRKQRGSTKSTMSPPPGTSSYLASLYKTPLLTHEQEYHLFRKMNYLKFRADALRQDLDVQSPNPELLDEIETLLDRALKIRNQIVQANLRLVVSIAKKLVDKANSFDELVSDGNVPLIRAVEIFDFERGTRFSTYATWAIRNNLFRSTPRNRKQQKRYLSGSDLPFETAVENRPSIEACENYYRQLKSSIDTMLSELDDRDQAIVLSRFGLDEDGHPHKFREISEDLNISTERVRQLLGRSLSRMRNSAEELNLESVS